MKKIRTSLLFLLLLSAGTLLFGEESSVDVIYLQNGSIIKGSITARPAEGPVKIETADGSLFVFSWDEIKEIATEEAAPEPSGRRQGGFFIGTGYSAVLTTSPDDGELNATYETPSFSLKLGGMISKHVGLVFGYEMSSNNDRSTMIGKLGPVVKLGRVQLYATGGFAWGEPLWNSGSGQGPYAGVGIDIELKNKLGLYFDIGFCLWNASFTTDSGTNTYSDPLVSTALALGLSWGN